MRVSKILKIVSLVIALIGVYFFVKVSSGEEGSEALSGSVGGFIAVAKWLLIIIGIIIVAFVVLDMIKHPSKLKKSAIGLVAFAILLGLAYMLAGDEQVITNTLTVEAGSSLSKNVSTGIVFSAILGIVAFGGFVLDSVKTLFK